MTTNAGTTRETRPVERQCSAGAVAVDKDFERGRRWQWLRLMETTAYTHGLRTKHHFVFVYLNDREESAIVA